MKESDFQSLFKRKNTIAGFFELKICKTKSFPFASVKEHQVQALLEVSSSAGLYHKISDSPIFRGQKTRFTSKKPFDCFYVQNQPAYVVVGFYIPRKPWNVAYIPIEYFLHMQSKFLEQDKKSFRFEDAKHFSISTQWDKGNEK